jgi:hypothetical protein
VAIDTIHGAGFAGEGLPGRDAFHLEKACKNGSK